MNRELTENEMHMITDKWDETNKLRVELIREKVAKTISSRDAALLEYLQELTDARRELVAPIDLSKLAQTNQLNALTLKQLAYLEYININESQIIYQAHVTDIPEAERKTQDICESYIVVREEKADAGIVVYGWSKNYWYANPSLRWLVKHLVERVNKNNATQI